MPESESAPNRQVRFESIVLPHLDRLLGFAVRRTSELSDAEDAIQDMCIRAWIAFDELRDTAQVRGWLFRILRTVISDSLVRQGRRQRLVPISRLEDVHETLVASEKDGVFLEMVSRMNTEMLHAALHAIPDDFSVAVEMHDIEGFRYQEIADILAIPIGTVMSRISRGRRLLAGVIVENQTRWALGVSDAPANPLTTGRRVTTPTRRRHT